MIWCPFLFFFLVWFDLIACLVGLIGWSKSPFSLSLSLFSGLVLVWFWFGSSSLFFFFFFPISLIIESWENVMIDFIDQLTLA